VGYGFPKPWVGGSNPSRPTILIKTWERKQRSSDGPLVRGCAVRIFPSRQLTPLFSASQVSLNSTYSELGCIGVLAFDSIA
jgi:hypothetical protein